MTWEFPEYPDNWDEIRKQVYERDNYTCVDCSATDVALHAHHKIPKSKKGSDELSNLETLCEDCHAEYHPHLKRLLILKRSKSRQAKGKRKPLQVKRAYVPAKTYFP